MAEKIIVVDEKDNVIGFKDRVEVDRLKLRYRVSMLWVKNSKNQSLLARRAYTKTHNPGKWGPAVAGTVSEGESYIDNIIKEAKEEIGLTGIRDKIKIGPKIKRDSEHKYFTQCFSCIINNPLNKFKIQEEEVAELKWFSKEELEKAFKENPGDFLGHFKEYLDIFYSP